MSARQITTPILDAALLKKTEQKVHSIHTDNFSFLNPKPSMDGILVTTGIILHKHVPSGF
jgi:hypothetical protein